MIYKNNKKKRTILSESSAFIDIPFRDGCQLLSL